MRTTPSGRRGPFPRLEAGDSARRLPDLETPAALVDLDRLAQNLDRMAAYTALHGLTLRPHVKTHKSPRIAAEQLRLGAKGLTCATPREAEVMSDVTDDILVAYPPVGGPRAMRLMSLPDSTRLTVALDSAAAVEQLALAARAAEREVSVLVEVDVGMQRMGLARPADVVGLARLVRDREPLRYAGIAFYPGHIRQHVSEQDAELERLTSDLSALIAELDRAQCTPWIVSGGSTPAAWRMHEVARVNEVRPGTYVYNDRTTAEIGACAWTDCAFTVLATVVSTAVPGQAVIDAGSKALGREPLRGAEGEGFGALIERPDVVVTRMSEEHGILDLSRSVWKPDVGEQVRIVPNHVCVVVHLNDVMHGVRGDIVETTWPVEARGR
ncbi:MAG TPA: alanine racemase [Gemmatimonadaceae bacterium]|nr:alanine racemase [Gemmatimonadaceae bacterium]